MSDARENEVNITVREEDLKNKTDSELLKDLLKIAFANRRDIREIKENNDGFQKIIEKICNKNNILTWQIRGLWATVIGGGGILLTILYLILGKLVAK